MNYRVYAIFAFFVCFLSDLSFLSAGINLEVGTGYRRDQLNWNTGVSPNRPNVLSELTWSDLEIWQINARFSAVSIENLYLRGNADYGWIFEGQNQDSDYVGNNRTMEFSRSRARSDQGNVYDATLGVGYASYFLGNRFMLAPIAGYSVHGQNLHMTEGVQLLSVQYPEVTFKLNPLGPFPGLHSTYKTLWNGPWLGFDGVYHVSSCLNMWWSAEYHRAKYHANGFWNLRSNLYDDFLHDAWGNGAVFSGGFQYLFYPGCYWGMIGNYQYWQTDSGRDRIFYLDYPNDESIEPIKKQGDIRLNRVSWSSWSVALELGLNW